MTTKAETNSRTTRVQPVFQWLIDNDGESWPERLVQMAHGMAVVEYPPTLLFEHGRMSHHETQCRMAWGLSSAGSLFGSRRAH